MYKYMDCEWNIYLYIHYTVNDRVFISRAAALCKMKWRAGDNKHLFVCATFVSSYRTRYIYPTSTSHKHERHVMRFAKLERKRNINEMKWKKNAKWKINTETKTYRDFDFALVSTHTTHTQIPQTANSLKLYVFYTMINDVEKWMVPFLFCGWFQFDERQIGDNKIIIFWV